MFGLRSALLLSEVTNAIASIPHNQLPGLVPAAGGWRGSTLGHDIGSVANYTAEYGVPLHIYRTFKREDSGFALKDEERDFIHGGGILFYSFQPHNWANWANASDADTANGIDEIAAAVKSVAPAKVMVCPGFEPNNHIGEFGSADEFVAMRRNFAARFAASGVSNAVWTMDYQRGMYKDWDSVKAVWPGNDIVDWLMFNAFGNKDKPKTPMGNFTLLVDEISDGLLRNSSEKFGFDKVPWGIGAYGPKTPLMSSASRNAFMQDVMKDLDSNRYPRLKALIYFDSLDSMVTTDLEDTYKTYLNHPFFTVNDESGLLHV